MVLGNSFPSINFETLNNLFSASISWFEKFLTGKLWLINHPHPQTPVGSLLRTCTLVHVAFGYACTDLIVNYVHTSTCSYNTMHGSKLLQQNMYILPKQLTSQRVNCTAVLTKCVKSQRYPKSVISSGGCISAQKARKLWFF